MSILQKIIEQKKLEVAALKEANVKSQLLQTYPSLPHTRSFANAIGRKPHGSLNLIAELKKASPSKGVMVEDFRPLHLARRYAERGASAFSILTDRKFFQGDPKTIRQVSSDFLLPVLRKDFIIDEVQIYESRLIGADAILLIVAALDDEQFKDYISLAEVLKLDVLTEVHDEAELERAVKADAKIIGVNNRDLNTFNVDVANSLRLKKNFPDGVIAVSESGLKTPNDLALVAGAGFDAVLIGEGLLASDFRMTLSEPSKQTWHF
jgi:indole-3-glycerol phosphate synthase